MVVAGLVGCSGPKGDKGDPGAEGGMGGTGATGPAGPSGPQGDAGTQGPVGPQGDAGTPGSSTGEVTVVVYDALTMALVAGAQVLASPGGELVNTGDAGVAVFPGLPVGIHTFAVEGQSLRQQGNDIVGSHLVSAPPVPVSVRAGTQSAVAVSLPRFWAQDFNLVSLHTKLTTTNLLFKDANCSACHGRRAAETARDGTTPGYHMRHTALNCTALCHGTVDLTDESGAQLRKQVSTAACVTCHTQFPTRICNVPVCP